VVPCSRTRKNRSNQLGLTKAACGARVISYRYRKTSR
jgi:hypothetical protein